MKRPLKIFIYALISVFILLNIVTAFHAYKFTHFYNLDISVTKPEQMTGWEKAQAIMFGVNYPKKKITELPQVPYKDFAVKTEDGLTLRGWHLKNADSVGLKGAVIMFHGHANNRAGISNEAHFFTSIGYNVYMIDFRAHGQSEGEVCTIGYKEARDVKAVYDYAKKEFADDQIVLYGISLGAATITKAIAEYPSIKPAKIILEMPFATLSDAVKGRLRSMRLPEQPFSVLLTFWGGTQQGFWGFNHNPVDYVKKINCPVLLQWGVSDARVTRKETELLLKNIKSEEKFLVPYEKSKHESLYKNETAKWTQSVTWFLQ
jgi:alpha-beta hydrolase superfamily lysophospholipase